MASKRKIIEMLDELPKSWRREIFDMYCGCGKKHENYRKILTSHCCVHQTRCTLKGSLQKVEGKCAAVS